MKVQTKIILLLALIIILFMSVVIFLRYSEIDRADLLFRDRGQDKNIFFDKLLKLKGNSLESFTFDYTYWDEMVRFVLTGDKDWAYQNIEVPLPNFNVHAVWVYKTDFSLVYSVNTLEDNSLKEIPLPEEAYKQLFIRSYFHHFFVNTPKGLMEIRSTPIQPSSDSERKTPPQGYFFAGRLWTQEYLDELSSLTESTITISPVEEVVPEDIYDREKGILTFSRTLPDWNGNPLVRVYVRSESNLIKELSYSSRRQFALFIAFATALLTFLSILLMRWISLPLKLISRSLKAEDPSLINSLQSNETEFGELTRLIQKFFEQKTDLVKEITERKRAEEQILFQASLLDQVRNAVIATDLMGKIIYWNKFAEILYQWRSEEVVGKNILEVTVPQKQRKHAEELLESIKNVGHWEGEFVVQRKNGTTFPAHVVDTIIKDVDNNIKGFVGVSVDITERKKMEAELLKTQKLESVGILAGGIAHDFNNILTAILLNISLAKIETDPRNRIFESLTEAEKACLRAKDLTQQLLTFSKGGAPVKKTASIIELIKDSANFALRGSNVKCEFYTPDNLWPVEIDEGQMSQVIHNLILNAQQAMPEGGVITIRAENLIGVKKVNPALPLPDGNYVKICVEDQGVGISKEYLSRIFDPYFTTKQKGSGLGLATTYSIIKKHGGYITLESELGVGTTFYIYLPAASEKQMLAEKITEERSFIGRGKILVMDDEELIRKAIGHILAYMGYAVVFTEDGTEAIEQYKSAREAGQPFDAVILDLTIPGGMGGKEVVRELLEINPQVKAIVSSGYSNDPVMANFRKYGFIGVATKPYKTEELSKLLYDMMNDK